MPSLWEKLKTAGSDLTDVPEIDPNDPILPKDQYSGAGMLNALRALGDVQPDPIEISPERVVNGKKIPATYFDPSGMIAAGRMSMIGKNFNKAVHGMPVHEQRLENTWGKMIQDLQDLRYKPAEVAGARLVDKYDTMDPAEVIRRMYAEKSGGMGTAPTVDIRSGGGRRDALGYYSYRDNNIVLFPDLIKESGAGRGIDSIINRIAETAGHEAQHAVEYNKSGFRGLNYITPEKRGFSHQKSIERASDYVDYILHNPKLHNSKMQLLAMELGLDAEGNRIPTRQLIAKHLERQMYPSSPNNEEISKFITELEQEVPKEALKGYATSDRPGERFRNPYLIKRLEQGGHFNDYSVFDMEDAISGATADMARKGVSVHPDLAKRFPEVRKAMDEYKSAVRPWAAKINKGD